MKIPIGKTMDGKRFIEVPDGLFTRFMADLGFFKELPTVSGRLYLVSFSHSQCRVSLSFEPGDDAFFVIIYRRENGELSGYDDRKNTLRMADLNRRYQKQIEREERIQNELFFRDVRIGGEEERILTKYAKELRLILPKYLASLEGFPN